MCLCVGDLKLEHGKYAVRIFLQYSSDHVLGMCQAMVDGICDSYFYVTVTKLAVRTNYRRK